MIDAMDSYFYPSLVDFPTVFYYLVREPVAYCIWNLEPALMIAPSLMLWRLAPFFARLIRKKRTSWPEVVVRASGIIVGVLASYPVVVMMHYWLIWKTSHMLTAGYRLGFSGIDRFGSQLAAYFTICESLGLAAFLFFIAPHAARHCLPPPEDADTAG
jgi:hypothetical protein